MTTKANTAKKAATAPKGFDDLSAFGQLNVEALTQASELATKAVEGINEELTTYTKKSFEDGVAAVKDLTSVKTPTELFEKQSAFAQSAFEGFVAQATKMNEIFMAATKEVTAPINARVEATTETFKSYAV
ncbi:MAG: phasin family protein [Paracoccaceae bacterium]